MKKILSIVLGGLLAVSAVFSASAATVDEFSDMPNDWSTPALTAAVENGLLTGSDGLILPKDNLTRAQMATIIVRAFAASSKDDLAGFTDVPASKWYFEYMQKAVAMGVFTGDGSGLLTPDNNITREQVFTVLARAFKLSDGDLSVLDKFADGADVSSWAKGYTAALVANGYVNGSDGRLNPKNNITRAEFAQIMFNMIKFYVDESTTLTGTIEGSVIVRASDVKIAKDANIKGNLVICEDCKNITIEEGAKIANIIDNRKDVEETPDVPEQKPEDEKKEDDKKDDKKDDDKTIIFGEQSNSDTAYRPNEGTGDEDDGPTISDDNDNVGWSGIYKP
ncbi:MAG: S-layer homology domain-containing protein [Ruminococcaceae bacterium]|nr:S-layer homology domain-containing protein [Oscillospiraceae bacterium]